MNSVGIDVSKGRITVTIINGDGEYIIKGKDFPITNTGFTKLLDIIHTLEGKTVACMEYTGHYYEPVALFLYENGVSTYVVNPILIHKYAGTSIRDGVKKTDSLDSQKIAEFIYFKDSVLTPFSKQDSDRLVLKLMNREFNSLEDRRTAMKNHLTSLLDRTFPEIKNLFTGMTQSNGHQPWVDFVKRFWHAKCVTKYSLAGFKKAYNTWCNANGYRYSDKKAERIYDHAKDAYASLPYNEITKDLIVDNVNNLIVCSVQVELVRSRMIEVAKTMPEFPAVAATYGVSESAAAQIISEVGDVRHFRNIKAFVAFAGLDPCDRQSGTHAVKSTRISKKGSPYLRRVVYQVITMIYMLGSRGLTNDPIYTFIAKKYKEEGKHYYVALTAGCGKFMRHYYGKVKAYLSNMEKPSAEESDRIQDKDFDDEAMDSSINMEKPSDEDLGNSQAKDSLHDMLANLTNDKESDPEEQDDTDPGEDPDEGDAMK